MPAGAYAPPLEAPRLGAICMTFRWSQTAGWTCHRWPPAASERGADAPARHPQQAGLCLPRIASSNYRETPNRQRCDDIFARRQPVQVRYPPCSQWHASGHSISDPFQHQFCARGCGGRAKAIGVECSEHVKAVQHTATSQFRSLISASKKGS